MQGVNEGAGSGEEETLKLHRFGCVVIGQFSKQRQADVCRAGDMMRVCVL